jgi:hypothetical protein
VLVISFLIQEVYATVIHEDSKAIRHRDLSVDLGEGIQIYAELTMLVLANHSLPAILLMHGAGPIFFYPPSNCIEQQR